MNRRLAALGLTLGLLTAGAGASTAALADTSGSTFVVTSTGDAPDSRADGTCAAADGTCTLRAAIVEANRRSGPVTIAFNLPGTGPFSLRPSTRLPEINNSAGITIDGYTQPGSRPNTAAVGSNAVISVQVVGQGAAGIEGLYLTGPNNVIRGLSIYNFRHSIWLNGAGASRNAIVGNFICTDTTGTAAATTVNGGAGGILAQNGASYNTIGVPQGYTSAQAPPSPADRNVISGCAHRGVILSYSGTTFNRVSNNIVGLNPAGTAALPNQSHGIDVNYTAQDNLIGGTRPGEGNVVSGNVQEGIEVSHGTYNRRNNVYGNYVGTDISGTQSLPYTGNGMMGIRLEGEKDCNPCAPGAGYSDVAYNVVVGNQGGVLIDKGQNHNSLHDNLIGVLPDGTAAGNALYAVRIEHGAQDNVLGPGNTIAYNAAGVQLLATGSQPPSSYVLPPVRNTITGNAMHDNGGLGIDVLPLNQPNVGGVGDPGVQDGIMAPTITSVSANQLVAATCPGCTVEAFSADNSTISATYSLDNYGEGSSLLGSATADSSGQVAVPFSRALDGGTVVTATATDAAGNTSEFAKNAATPGLLPPTITTAGPANPGNLDRVPFAGSSRRGYVVTVDVTDGTSRVTASATAGANGAWSLTAELTPLADGTLTVSATASNSPDNVSTATTTTMQKTSTVPPPSVTATAAGVTTAAIDFAAPPPVEGVSVTGYTVTLTSDTGSRVTPLSADSRSWSAADLLDGTSYSLTLVANTTAGDSQPATTTFATKSATSLSIAWSQFTVPAGQPLVLRGVLQRTRSGSPVSGRSVDIYQVNPDRTRALVVAGVPTAGDGSWQASLAPVDGSRYQADFVGDGTDAFSRSAPTAIIRVR